MGAEREVGGTDPSTLTTTHMKFVQIQWTPPRANDPLGFGPHATRLTT